MKRIVWIILGLLVLVFLYLALICGLFNKVTVEKKKMGPYTFAYKEHKGSYTHTEEWINEVQKTLDKAGINHTKGLGIYYDNPQNTTPEKLRCKSGCLISSKDLDKLNGIKTDLQVDTYPEQNYICSHYPFPLDVCIMLGISRVYPKIETFRKDHNIPPGEMIEIYDKEANRITYLMPVKK